jgi:long-subunit fatty acid transport protein
MVTGSAASVRFWLPPSARAGVSWHATPALEIEAALDVELWSLHDAIEIAPDHVQLGAYPLQTIEIPRELGTSISPSLGGELHVGDAAFGAGLAYETAATPRGDVSVLTVDSAKWIVGAGGGYAADGWQLGVAAGFVRLADVSVSAADARVPVLDPFEPASARRANAGTYRSYDVLAGLRAARRF